MIKTNWIPPSFRIKHRKNKMGAPIKYEKFYVYDFKGKSIGEFDRDTICTHFNKTFGSLFKYINKPERINGFYYIVTEKR